MATDSPETVRKALIDAVLLKLPGVVANKINKLDAYFVSDRMFACINGEGLGLRLPVATVTELQFSRSDVVPFPARQYQCGSHAGVGPDQPHRMRPTTSRTSS